MKRWAVAAALVLAGVALAGCTSVPQARPTPRPSVHESAVDVVADSLIRNPILPPGAKSVASLAGKNFARPAQGPAMCTGTGDRALYWVVSGTIRSVADYLKTHTPRLFVYSGEGTSYRDTARSVLLTASILDFRPGIGKQAQIVYTIAPTSSHRIGIRLDGEVVPVGASCGSAGYHPKFT
jgi:hypothetical protein